MAEGLLRQLGGNRFEVHSAGVAPTNVRSEAIEAMSELDIDISHHRSNNLRDRNLVTQLPSVTTRIRIVPAFPVRPSPCIGVWAIPRWSKVMTMQGSRNFAGCASSYATSSIYR